MSELTVTIPLDRFEALIDTETRVDVAVERICNAPNIDMETVLRILGTPWALDRADELKTAAPKADCKEKYTGQTWSITGQDIRRD